MGETIDVRDLSTEDVRFVQKLVAFLRNRALLHRAKEKEPIRFATWELGAKGSLSRREIYEGR